MDFKATVCRIFSLLILVQIVQISVVGSSTVELYSLEEKAGLKQLRKLLQDEVKNTPEYYQTDEVLIGFLRAKNLDPVQANEMIRKALQWRRHNGIEHILKEKYPYYEKHYPALEGLVDKKGRPTVIIPIGAWDVRKAVIAGQSEQLTRYLERFFEKGFQEIRENFGENNKNRNISQFNLILDLAGYNLRQHACVGCIPIYIRLLQNYELYYPQGVYKFYLINTPAIFDALLQILKPFMSAHTKNALKIYGFDKTKWGKVLLDAISPDNLPAQYGGIKKVDLH